MQQTQVSFRTPSVLSSLVTQDNRAWFRATSTKLTAEKLQRLFRKRNVGVALLQRVSTIAQGATKTTLFLQIELLTNVITRVDMISKEPVWRAVRSYAVNETPWPEWMVEVCLRELGIVLEEEVPAAVAMAAQHGRQ